jgi:hypothetical protein
VGSGPEAAVLSADGLRGAGPSSGSASRGCPGAATLGLAVVVTFFARGGRPVPAGWWISIRHPVPAASRGDIVVGENRAVWRAMAAFYVVTLLKASLVQQLSNRSCCSGGNPEIRVSRSDDDVIMVPFLSWEHRLWSSDGCRD